MTGSLRYSDTVESLDGTHKDLSIGYSGGGVDFFVEIIAGDDMKARAILKDSTAACIFKHVDASGCCNWGAVGGAECAGGVENFSGDWFETGVDAEIINDMQIITDEEWRRDVRHTAFISPRDMSFRNIAMTTESDCVGFFGRRTSEAEDQTMTDGRGTDKFFAGTIGVPDDRTIVGIQSDGLL